MIRIAFAAMLAASPAIADRAADCQTTLNAITDLHNTIKARRNEARGLDVIASDLVARGHADEAGSLMMRLIAIEQHVPDAASTLAGIEALRRLCR